MKEVILFLVTFIIVYLLYLIFVILNKKKMDKFKDNTYFKFLIKMHKLDKNKVNIKKSAHIIALGNAFIIAITFTVVTLVDNFILSMILGFGILVPLLLFVYYILGKVLSKI